MVTVTGGGVVAPGIGLPMKGRPSRSTACCATTFVIYDGRVGAALGLLTRQFCEATGHTEGPSALEFAFGTPKEARNTKNTKVRDPSHGPLRFPRLGPDARFQTVQAMRANWFLGRALNRNPNAFSAGERRIP